MSELMMLIFSGSLRVVLGTLLFSGKGKIIDKNVLICLLLSFLYSTVLTVLLILFSRPIVLGIGMIVQNDSLFPFLSILYSIVFILTIFFLEFKNNFICLNESYPDETIRRNTIISHAFSLLVMVIYTIA